MSSSSSSSSSQWTSSKITTSENYNASILLNSDFISGQPETIKIVLPENGQKYRWLHVNALNVFNMASTTERSIYTNGVGPSHLNPDVTLFTSDLLPQNPIVMAWLPIWTNYMNPAKKRVGLIKVLPGDDGLSSVGTSLKAFANHLVILPSIPETVPIGAIGVTTNIRLNFLLNGIVLNNNKIQTENQDTALIETAEQKSSHTLYELLSVVDTWSNAIDLFSDNLGSAPYDLIHPALSQRLSQIPDKFSHLRLTIPQTSSYLKPLNTKLPVSGVVSNLERVLNAFDILSATPFFPQFGPENVRYENDGLEWAARIGVGATISFIMGSSADVTSISLRGRDSGGIYFSGVGEVQLIYYSDLTKTNTLVETFTTNPSQLMTSTVNYKLATPLSIIPGDQIRLKISAGSPNLRNAGFKYVGIFAAITDLTQLTLGHPDSTVVIPNTTPAEEYYIEWNWAQVSPTYFTNPVSTPPFAEVFTGQRIKSTPTGAWGPLTTIDNYFSQNVSAQRFIFKVPEHTHHLKEFRITWHEDFIETKTGNQMLPSRLSLLNIADYNNASYTSTIDIDLVHDRSTNPTPLTHDLVLDIPVISTANVSKSNQSVWRIGDRVHPITHVLNKASQSLTLLELSLTSCDQFQPILPSLHYVKHFKGSAEPRITASTIDSMFLIYTGALQPVDHATFHDTSLLQVYAEFERYSPKIGSTPTYELVSEWDLGSHIAVVVNSEHKNSLSFHLEFKPEFQLESVRQYTVNLGRLMDTYESQPPTRLKYVITPKTAGAWDHVNDINHFVLPNLILEDIRFSGIPTVKDVTADEFINHASILNQLTISNGYGGTTFGNEINCRIIAELTGRQILPTYSALSSIADPLVGLPFPLLDLDARVPYWGAINRRFDINHTLELQIDLLNGEKYLELNTRAWSKELKWWLLTFLSLELDISLSN